jgi:predicted Zn-dependent protease
MRFEFTAPDGFRLQNSPEKVLASDPGGAAIVFDISPARNAGNPAAYLQHEWATKAKLRGVEDISVNGLRGATGATVGQTDRGAVDIRLVALQRDGKSMYRLMFLSPRNRTASLDEAFRRTAWSFRRISAEEAAAVKPLRIAIRAAKPGERIATLAAPLPYGALNEEWFRVLNDLPPGASLPHDRPLKIIGT